MALPAASIVLLTYNQEPFVEQALLSLLNQDRDDIEIIISDDRSRDGTWQSLEQLVKQYSGPKKIILSQNPTNLGIVDNYRAAIQKCSGNLILMAAGDDISTPDRCSQSIQFWLDHHQCYDLVAADAWDMDYDGTVLAIKQNSDLQNETLEQWFQERPFFFGASHMVTRRLLDLAPLNNQLPYEDQCLVFRAMLMGGAARLPLPLVYHRRGGMTQKLGFDFGGRRKQIIRDMSREIIELEQFLADASALGQRVRIEQSIIQKRAYCQAILTLFQHPASLKAFLVFWTNSAVPTKDKRRYARYYWFYPLLAMAHGLRDLIRAVKLNARQRAIK